MAFHPKKIRDFIILAIAFFSLVACKQAPQQDSSLLKSHLNSAQTLTLTNQHKPWTRWWWHGNAVTQAGISYELAALKAAGVGGVEITPIFGTYGEEDQFIEFLSPKWMQMFVHTLNEAKRLGLGVDLATGTGWPFGGPWISETQAAKNINYKQYQLAQGQQLTDKIEFIQKPMLRALNKKASFELIKTPLSANQNLQALAIEQIRFEKSLPLLSLMAYSDSGDVIELTEKVHNGQLNWIAPHGNWTLYAIFMGQHGKMVERAAPGGEGSVIDHFSKPALEDYLAQFDLAFKGQDISYLRAFFNDSYEVDDAAGQGNWTPALFSHFKQLHGYDLKTHLPVLLNKENTEYGRQILTDYRTTIEDMLYHNFTQTWKNWAHNNQALVRNQAHGSPANILDLYELVDIPETEGEEMIKIKFASSSANFTNKPLIGAEAATWLNEHFESDLTDIRKNMENYWLGGVNHLVYHGTAYSPKNAAWPGHLFYAAIHFNDRNPLWHDWAELNQYAANVQYYLQNSQHDNDYLVYFPIYDRYAQVSDNLLEHFDIWGKFNKTEVKKLADKLLKNGYAFDFVSDKQIAKLASKQIDTNTKASDYKAILVPKTNYMPLETYQALFKLAEQGIQIIFFDQHPKKATGYANISQNQAVFSALSQLWQQDNPAVTFESFNHNPDWIKTQLPQGIRAIRKNYQTGKLYFIVNDSLQAQDVWLPLAKLESSNLLINPHDLTQGLAEIESNGTDHKKIHVQLQAGESVLLLSREAPFKAKPYLYFNPGNTTKLTQPWALSFTSGGPELAPALKLDKLMSWSELGQTYQYFSGRASYVTYFSNVNLSNHEATDYIRLNLGEVANSAQVFINGHKIKTLTGPDFSVVLKTSELKASNHLEVIVSNTMANRIRYMDQHNLNYKTFYNINFPARKPQNRQNGLFTAEHWQPKKSGLLGPVTITELSVNPINK